LALSNYVFKIKDENNKEGEKEDFNYLKTINLKKSDENG
jgi:hypothetical protein